MVEKVRKCAKDFCDKDKSKSRGYVPQIYTIKKVSNLKIFTICNEVKGMNIAGIRETLLNRCRACLDVTDRNLPLKLYYGKWGKFGSPIEPLTDNTEEILSPLSTLQKQIKTMMRVKRREKKEGKRKQPSKGCPLPIEFNTADTFNDWMENTFYFVCESSWHDDEDEEEDSTDDVQYWKTFKVDRRYE